MIEIGDKVRIKSLNYEGKEIMTVVDIRYRTSSFNDIPYIEEVICEYETKCQTLCRGRYSPQRLRRIKC